MNNPIPEQPLRLRHRFIDEDKRANLLNYIESLDHVTPPIFVGREELIERIKKDVAKCRTNRDINKCFTLVISGAPGAGKSSLLSELETQLRHKSEDERRNDHSVVVVPLRGVNLSNVNAIANAMVSAYREQVSNNRREKSRKTTVDRIWSWIGFSKQVINTEPDLQELVKNYGSIWEPVFVKTSLNKSETVFLFLIDEAQKTPGDRELVTRKLSSMVCELHQGLISTGGIKILPIFAGHSDTQSVLAQRGVARIGDNASIHLGPLSQAETEEIVSAWMRHQPFGLEDMFVESDIDRVSKLIAVASEGWPRHTNSYLRELGRSVLKNGDMGGLTVEIKDMLDHGHDRLSDYFGNRLRIADLRQYEDVICEATQQSSDGKVNKHDLYRIARNILGLKPLETDTLHNRAIHAGVLEPASNHDLNRFKFPIPSFFTYMQCGKNPEEFKEAKRQQIAEHMH